MTSKSAPHGLSRRAVLAAGGSAALLTACATKPAMSPASDTRRVLWAANVRNKPFEERLTAARIGGFTHMSVFPIDWRGWTDQGLTAPDHARPPSGGRGEGAGH
jgi:hypothetical protein